VNNGGNEAYANELTCDSKVRAEKQSMTTI